MGDKHSLGQAMGWEQVRRMDTQAGAGKRKKTGDSTARKMPSGTHRESQRKAPVRD